MPAAYALDPDHALAAVAGDVDGPGLVRSVRTLHADPRWRPEFDTVWDGGTVTGLMLDLPEIHIVADLRFGRAPCRAPGRAAGPALAAPSGRGVLVVQRWADEEVARLFAAMARRHGGAARVVESVPEALTALGHGPWVWAP